MYQRTLVLKYNIRTKRGLKNKNQIKSLAVVANFASNNYVNWQLALPVREQLPGLSTTKIILVG